MKVTVKEDTVVKETQWGPVTRSLNQHMVFVNGSLAGYVGKTSFLPLCGFPRELVDSVSAKCGELLGRQVLATEPPPSMEQLAVIVSGIEGDKE